MLTSALRNACSLVCAALSKQKSALLNKDSYIKHKDMQMVTSEHCYRGYSTLLYAENGLLCSADSNICSVYIW